MKNRNAFTLIEILVVVAILGILAAIVIPLLIEESKKGQDMPDPNTITMDVGPDIADPNTITMDVSGIRKGQHYEYSQRKNGGRTLKLTDVNDPGGVFEAQLLGDMNDPNGIIEDLHQQSLNDPNVIIEFFFDEDDDNKIGYHKYDYYHVKRPVSTDSWLQCDKKYGIRRGKDWKNRGLPVDDVNSPEKAAEFLEENITPRFNEWRLWIYDRHGYKTQ